MIETPKLPSKETLLMVDALLFAVYGLEPAKVKDMKLQEIFKLLAKAKKDITWGQAYKFTSLMESKPTTLWQKILKKLKN